MTVTALEIDMAGLRLRMNGTAQTRDALLALEQGLEALPWLEEVNIPLSQLIQPPPLPFSFDSPIVR